ncbi:hypothetical protein G8764_17095 [Pseudomaricurvus alcaniphilus]|uniref:TIGR02466 family protein n=1 Tax=Pseudomaricurvus alcaniphilus TaxID=1166482 RepID=UPI00140CE49E|nr:TIGR02466 family protein [Pseudomaricurvus alcaniphilus]NHN39028.1 hypothetical protein [Pseudomaricurvus alcaniphilus]
MSENDNRLGVLQRELYFPTLIYFKDLDDAVPLNDGLKAGINGLREEDKVGLHRSNVKQAGAWHSQDDLNHRPQFGPLVEAVEHCAQQVFDDLQYDSDFVAGIDNMWANVSPRHAFNRMHIHPGVIWSGVYYVQSPESSGRIYFTDPRIQAQILRPRISKEGRDQALNWSEVYFEPLAGRIILFPAWLVHEVEPNLSQLEGDEGLRISISFNLVQRPKSTGGA